MADQKLTDREEIFSTNSSDEIHIVRHNKSYRMNSNLLQGAAATDVISGNATFGGTTYTGTGLIYDSFSHGAIIDSTFYSNLVIGLNTLSPGDATNGRIDVWAVELNLLTEPASLSIVVIEGVPSSTPLKPSVDITFQAELSFRTVPALETEDSTTVVNQVYDENVEWTNTTLTTGGNLDEATDPYIGLKNFKTPATSNDSVSWTDSGLTTFNGNDSLKFAARLIVDKDVKIRIKLINSSNNNYWLKTLKQGDFNNFGLDESDPNWQLLQIRLSEFQAVSRSETQYDRIEFTFGNTPVLELDRIEFQSELEQSDAGVRQLDLIDTPNSYIGKAGQIQKMNEAEDAWEFSETPTIDPDIIIVGGATEIPSEIELALFLTNVLESEITSFQIIDGDVFAKMETIAIGTYTISDYLRESTLITALIVDDTRCTLIESNAFNTTNNDSNLEFVVAPFVVTFGTDVFIDCKNLNVTKCDFSSLVTIGNLCFARIDSIAGQVLKLPKVTSLASSVFGAFGDATIEFNTYNSSTLSSLQEGNMIMPNFFDMGDPATNDNIWVATSATFINVPLVHLKANNGQPHASLVDAISEGATVKYLGTPENTSELVNGGDNGANPYLSTDLSGLGLFADDTAAGVGGVAVGEAYINSSTGAVHRRLS